MAESNDLDDVFHEEGDVSSELSDDEDMFGDDPEDLGAGVEVAVGVVDGDGPDSYFFPAAGTYQRAPVRNNRLPRNPGRRPPGLTQATPALPSYLQPQRGTNKPLPTQSF